MKKKIWWIGTIVALLGITLAILLVLAFIGHARRPPNVIRAELLSLAPPGTPLDEVKALIVKKGWDKGKGWREGSKGNWSEIMTQYGSFRPLDSPLSEVKIEVHWHFDDSGRLSNISLHYYQGGFIGFSEVIHVEGE